jgi:hypothetical protein
MLPSRSSSPSICIAEPPAAAYDFPGQQTGHNPLHLHGFAFPPERKSLERRRSPGHRSRGITLSSCCSTRQATGKRCWLALITLGYCGDTDKVLGGSIAEREIIGGVKQEYGMRVTLKHAVIGLYYAGRKLWVGEPDSALDLETIERATELSSDNSFGDVDIVVTYDDPCCELVLPLRRKKELEDESLRDAA